MKTVKERIEELKQPPPEFTDLDVLAELPEDMPAPTVSNLHKDAGQEESAWISFSSPSHDPEGTHDPAGILRTLEEAGFVSVPTTLVRWGDYRARPYPGTAEDAPEKRYRETLTDLWPMCPLWVSPCQHTNPAARTFYRSPSGLLLMVSVDLPRVVGVHAKRVEHRGGWRFERGTAKLHHPDAWHHVYMGDESVAGLHAKCCAQVDTEHGVSGVIYWESYVDPFPMSPAAMLTYLLESAAKPMDPRG